METTRFSNGFYGRKSLWVALTSIFLLATFLPRAAQSKSAEVGKRLTPSRAAEMLARAKVAEKEERYYAALGLVESVLAMDASNEKALMIKQRLDETIDMRARALYESSRGRFRALRSNEQPEEAQGQDLPGPKNPHEIAGKRKNRLQYRRTVQNTEVGKQLQQIRVDLSSLSQETSFRDAIEQLKTSGGGKPLNIVVMWKDLEENTDIDETTPIKMDPISGVSLGTALELLLASVSGPDAELGYAVRGGVIRIATKESLSGQMKTAVYDATDILNTRAGYDLAGYGGGYNSGNYGGGYGNNYGGNNYGGRNGGPYGSAGGSYGGSRSGGSRDRGGYYGRNYRRPDGYGSTGGYYGGSRSGGSRYGGSRYGGSRYGGSRYGGSRDGGSRYGGSRSRYGRSGGYRGGYRR